MKTQKVVKEIIKTEKLPQGQTKILNGRRSKNSLTSNVYTVKETTLEKRIKRSSGNEGSSILKSSEHIISSNLKQGTNSGSYFQNKIPVSNKEDNRVTKIIKSTTTRTTKNNISDGYLSKRYTKREIDKIIKIQRWWRRILAILKGYEIRESLFSNNSGTGNYVVKSQKIYTEKYTSNRSSNSNQPSSLNFKNSTKSYTSLNNINTNSKSYTNINNVTSNMKRNLNATNINVSSSENFIQTVDKRLISQNSPRGAPSGSTSPSVGGKYIIETKKVEVFRKPKNTSVNKFVKEENINTSTSITNYEVRQLMKDIWSNEIYCSTVESLCCLGDDGKSNVSQNTAIFEEYEEEIRKLKSIIMQKDDELNNLTTNLNNVSKNLKETKKELNINITKNMQLKNGFNQQKLDQDAHELQIISMKMGWNDVNIPSPVNEIYIESIENRMPQRMQYIEGMQIMGKKQEESVQESISDPEAVLEIQEMNALSIISNKKKVKNICQHLQSLMILSKRNDEEEYYIKEKEEKNLEIIPVEKEPLVFQKIEQINYKSRPKPRKPKNQIQELDGLEIINYKKPDLRRKKIIKFIIQNIDKIGFKYEEKKIIKKKNTIQELDGLEILKSVKKQNMPQCVDELEISREYDMLLVKPAWNSLQIQGSGLNLLAIPRDRGLENQEVDEFEILGLEKPELFIESLEKISFEKPKVQKIQVLIPLPENKIKKSESFRIYGIKKEPEIKIVEKFIERKAPENKIVNFKFLIRGRTRVVKNKTMKMENLFIKGKEKLDIKKIIKLEDLLIKGREKVDNKKVIKNEKVIIRGRQKKVEANKIFKNDKLQIDGEEREENKIVKKDRIQFKGKPQRIVGPNKIIKYERFAYKGKPQRIVGPNKIIKYERFTYRGKPQRVVGPNKIIKNDKLIIKAEEKVYNNSIINKDKIQIKGKEKKIVQNRIINNDKIQFKGKPEKVIRPNKIIKYERFTYKGKQEKIVKNRVTKTERFIIEGLEEVEKEENVEDSVIEISIIKKQKKVVPNKIKKSERFIIRGIAPKKEEYVPVQRKGFVEKINKTVIKKEEVVENKKQELFIENIEDLNISKDYSTKQEIHEFNNISIGRRFVINIKGIKKKQEQPKTIEKIVEKIITKDWNELLKPKKETKLLIKNAYNKVKIPEKQEVIEKEEIETVEKIYKNWNDEIKPVKSTKLNIKGIKKVVEIVEQEKEKEEYDIENFALNISACDKKFRDSLHIENGGFDLEGNKGMILKEGPAQTIKITKEQILIPSKALTFNLLGKQKAKIILKSIKENKLFIKGKPKETIEVKKGEKIKTVEKIVEIEKEIDWNKFNKIKKEGLVNIIIKKKIVTLAKQRTNSIILKGTDKKEIQIIEKTKEKVVEKDWKNTLHAQRNAKFTLLGKSKKKYKLIVANGDKFYIQKESEDEIIYNDDYNSRKEKQKLKGEDENKKQIIREKEIIKEKEYVPRLQREIRAQISRVKESESETSSSISEIDVLAQIKAQKTMGFAGATSGTTGIGIIGHKKTGEFINGYQTKIINGEVVFTAKNGLGVNLGGTKYQKEITSTKSGYTKTISGISSNKMSGIEIINPNTKKEIYYQKLTGASGAIADGNYKIISTKLINDKGLSGSVSCKQMKIISNSKTVNPEIDYINNNNNGQTQSFRKQVIITSKTENVKQNQNKLNGSPSTNVIFKTRTKDSKNSKNSNNSKIKESPNSGNNIRLKESPNSANYNLGINQQKIVFNTRLKTDTNSENSQRSVGAGQGQNKTITTTRQYEMRIKTNGDKNEKVITESQKTTEVKYKSKKKKIEQLRDIEP